MEATPVTSAEGWRVNAVPVTTSGTIALVNLDAQISGRQALACQGRLTVAEQAGLLELITLRGQILGRIADYEQVVAEAEQLVRDACAEPLAYLARARARATFHLFTQALDDLATAERLGIDPAQSDTERAPVLQALGCYDQAEALLHQAVQRRPGFESFGALAGLHAERGDTASAEALFDVSRARYRGLSPFPLALLDLQRGRMWLKQGSLSRARPWFEAARRRLPACAPAQGHLAAVEAAQGDATSAIDRLRLLVDSSDDPHYTGQLARTLAETGRTSEARHWRATAAARYDQLCTRYPEAFADHAARFRLTVGGNFDRAPRPASSSAGEKCQ